MTDIDGRDRIGTLAPTKPTIRSGVKASQTTLKRRNGRLTSRQNNTRILGPPQRPPPLLTSQPLPSLGGDNLSSPGYSSTFETTFVTSPLEPTFADDYTPAEEQDNHYHHHFGSDSRFHTNRFLSRDDQARDGGDGDPKRLKVFMTRCHFTFTINELQ
jgi:hypothetical protein